MIDPLNFLATLKSEKVDFFAGVPDSLMKGLSLALSNSCSDIEHTITNNEGGAIAQAIGHFASTQNPAVVYMQNSGLGNAYNPLVSLADDKVYGIPMLLLIGWRGEIDENGTQLKDEPQHVKQGQVTLKTLEALQIPYSVFKTDSNNWPNEIRKLVRLSVAERRPVAAVFCKNTFKIPQKPLAPLKILPALRREEAIEHVVESCNANDVFVASTGMISRELLEVRKRKNLSTASDFLTVGGMGHASQIAIRISKVKTKRRVICLDGDGSLLMHAGGLLECGKQPNFVHVVLNNGAHDSVGGQPTNAFDINLRDVARGFGYQNVILANSSLEIKKSFTYKKTGSSFIEIQCRRGSRDDLGRPDKLPVENLNDFMKFLKS